jgi:hypothetical protein
MHALLITVYMICAVCDLQPRTICTGRTIPLYNAALDPTSTAYIPILQDGVVPTTSTFPEGSFLADLDRECETGGCYTFCSDSLLDIHKADCAGDTRQARKKLAATHKKWREKTRKFNHCRIHAMEGSIASDFTRMPRCMIPTLIKTACADRAYCTLTKDEHERIRVARLIINEIGKDNAIAIDVWNTHIQPKVKAWIDGSDRLSVALAIVWAGCQL